jgi:penicillin-binding protein 2
VHASNGTAKRIRSKRYTIAGKTGTAQVFTIAQDAVYNKKNTAYELRDHALFISYAPIKDPKIAVIVVAEHGGSGSGTAAPIAKKILDYYLLNILNQDKI